MQCNYIELGGKDGNIFRRKIIIDIKDKEQVLKKQNFTDTYSTVYRYDNKNQDIAILTLYKIFGDKLLFQSNHMHSGNLNPYYSSHYCMSD